MEHAHNPPSPGSSEPPTPFFFRVFQHALIEHLRLTKQRLAILRRPTEDGADFFPLLLGELKLFTDLPPLLERQLVDGFLLHGLPTETKTHDAAHHSTAEKHADEGEYHEDGLVHRQESSVVSKSALASIAAASSSIAFRIGRRFAATQAIASRQATPKARSA